MTVAKQTINNFIEKASRLYEQKRRAGSSASPLEMYVRRWLSWAEGGFGEIGHTDRRKTAPRRTVPFSLAGGRLGCEYGGLPLPAPTKQTQRAEAGGKERQSGGKRGWCHDVEREALIRSGPPRPDIGAGCHA
jgi:hypothetical protein